jgi:hypothetical protein
VKGAKKSNRQEQLHRLLNHHSRMLSEAAIRSDGEISESKLLMLERLARLIEIQKASKPPTPHIRWPVITLLAVTLVIVSLLLFARVSSTEIEMDLSLSEVSFRLPQLQVLTDEMQLSSLGLSGTDEIQLPRSETTDAEVFRASDGSGSAIRLTPLLSDAHPASVTLAAIILPAGTHCGLRPMEIPQQYRLFIKGTAQDLQAGVYGLIEIGQPGIPPKQLNFLTPKSILFRSDSSDIDLDINLLKGAKNTFSRQLLADSLSFFHVDEHVNAEQTIVRRISTVLSGMLYFESLGGKEYRLRPGQELRFQFSDGEIRTLELKDDRIAFEFHGQVKGMTTGSDKSQIGLMPTYLEWLSARHGLSLLWGTTLYIFGLILSVVRWWKTPSQSNKF